MNSGGNDDDTRQTEPVFDPVTHYALNRGPRLSQVVVERISVDDKVKVAGDGTIGFVTVMRKIAEGHVVEVTTEDGIQNWYRIDQLEKLPDTSPAPIKIHIS